MNHNFEGAPPKCTRCGATACRDRDGECIPPLTFGELAKANKARCEKVFHPINAWSLSDWGVAVAGETGEACNIIKKIRRIQDKTNTSKDPQSLHEAVQLLSKELADIIIYADLTAQRAGINLGDAVRQKFNEVSELRNCKIIL